MACLACGPWMAGACERAMRSRASSTPNSLSSSAGRQLSPPRRLALPLLRLVLTARGCPLQLRVERSVDRSGAPTSTRLAFSVNARLSTVRCHQPVRGRLRMQSPTPQHHAATAIVVEGAAAAAAFARLNHAAAALPPASPAMCYTIRLPATPVRRTATCTCVSPASPGKTVPACPEVQVLLRASPLPTHQQLRCRELRALPLRIMLEAGPTVCRRCPMVWPGARKHRNCIQSGGPARGPRIYIHTGLAPRGGAPPALPLPCCSSAGVIEHEPPAVPAGSLGFPNTGGAGWCESRTRAGGGGRESATPH